MRTIVSFVAFTPLLLSSLAIAQKNPNPEVPPRPMPTRQPINPPGQGKPDITSAKGGIIIGGAVGGAGGKFVPWGGFADLSDVEPLPGTVVEGRCAFNATYVETNIGGAPTSPAYTNKLKLDGSTDVAINTARHLNAGETKSVTTQPYLSEGGHALTLSLADKSVTTQPYLSEGGHALTLSLDDGNLVAESNEGNNLFSIKYRLQCKKPGTPSGQRLPDLIPVLPSPMNGHVAVKNIGGAPTSPAYTNKLKLDGSTDVAINTARHLNAGETKSVTTQPYLSEGGHALS